LTTALTKPYAAKFAYLPLWKICQTLHHIQHLIRILHFVYIHTNFVT